MPHIDVKLYPGPSKHQKTRLAERIVRDVVDTLNCDDSSVSVAIEEVEPEDWTEKVYEPAIAAHWGQLYKTPGYRPSR